MKIKVVIALSGGMDSTSLLLHLLRNGNEVYAISFYYGQKHSIELNKLQTNLSNLDYLSDGWHAFPGKLISWNRLDMSFIKDLFFSALLGSEKIPEGHYAEENMKKTVVPNRNAIFSSILYGYALSLANKYNERVLVSLGVHRGDHQIYLDCRKMFFDSLMRAFQIGNWNSEKVDIYLPYINKDKYEILQDVQLSCQKLSLNFQSILYNTHTCYQPDDMGRACGKCGSDVERILAFFKLKVEDPVVYVDSWEDVLKHALKMEMNFKNK